MNENTHNLRFQTCAVWPRLPKVHKPNIPLRLVISSIILHDFWIPTYPLFIYYHGKRTRSSGHAYNRHSSLRTSHRGRLSPAWLCLYDGLFFLSILSVCTCVSDCVCAAAGELARCFHSLEEELQSISKPVNIVTLTSNNPSQWRVLMLNHCSQTCMYKRPHS